MPLLWALVSLLQIGRWWQVQQQRKAERTWRPWWIGLRLVAGFVLPIMLLVGARLVLHIMGAQSWLEGFNLLTDVILWIWAIALLFLLTATLRLVLFWQLLKIPQTRRDLYVYATTNGFAGKQ
jgi:hypothetical protein